MLGTVHTTHTHSWIHSTGIDLVLAVWPAWMWAWVSSSECPHSPSTASLMGGQCSENTSALLATNSHAEVWLRLAVVTVKGDRGHPGRI